MGIKAAVFVLILILGPHTRADNANCPLRKSSQELYKLAQEVEAACDWTIEQIAKASLIKKCAEAPKSEGIRFRGGEPPTLRFTQFSDSYDTSDELYFCKNKKGHERRLYQVVKRLKEGVEKAQAERSRKRYEENRPKRSTKRAPASNEAKPQRYRCLVPGYYGTTPIDVDEGQVYGIQHTYGDVCRPIKD